MKKTYLTLLVMTMMTVITTDAHADVVYEPLIVASGFNRDVIAENTPIGSHAVSTIDASGTNSCFGTRSVIASVNSGKFSEEDYAKTLDCGWPDDNGNPSDRIITCIEDASTSYSDPDVYWHLAPYDEPNALCIRPDAGNPQTGTLKFKKVGC